jgi:hypothetical protein
MTIGRTIHRFPLVVGLIAVGVILGCRAYYGVPLGPEHEPADDCRAYSGFLVNPADFLTYASWAEQARQGHWLFSDLYTNAPHAGIYFNPYYQLVGRLATLFHAEPIAVMNVLAMAAALAVVFLVYDASLGLGWSAFAARTTCLLAAFSSGWTGWLILGHSKISGADFGYGDLIPCNGFAASPYHTFALAIQVFLLWSLIRGERWCAEGKPGRAGVLAGVAVLAALVAAIRPYDVVFPLISYAAYVGMSAWSSLGNEPLPWKSRLYVLTAMLLGALPVLAYTELLIQLPIWHNFAAKSLANLQRAQFWTIGFGAALVLSLWGAHLVTRNIRKMPAASWLAIWVCLVVGCFIFLEIRCSKLLGGAYIVMSLLAGLAVEEIARAIRDLRLRWMRAVSWAALGGLALSGVPSYALYLAGLGETIDRYDREIVDVAADLAARPDATVLTDAITGNRLPGLLGTRVWMGHWALTPKYRDKARQLQEAGIFAGVGTENDSVWNSLKTSVFVPLQVSEPYNLDAMRSKLQELIAASGCDFLLLNNRVPAYRIVREHIHLPVLRETKRWTLFQIVPR